VTLSIIGIAGIDAYFMDTPDLLLFSEGRYTAAAAYWRSPLGDQGTKDLVGLHRPACGKMLNCEVSVTVAMKYE
jgi:hypothetical protein